MLKKISIIVPIYNMEKYLEECLESILRQTYENIEVILVDDGSTDRSGEVCKSYEQKDKRVVYLKKGNEGVSATRNFGIKHSSGDFIMFVDSDDFIENTCCEQLLRYMTDDIDMVVLGLQKYFTETKRVELINHRVSKGKYTLEEIGKIVIDDGTISGFTLHSSCAVLYRRSIILNNQLYFRPAVYYNEDGLFNVEYVLSCTKSIFIDYLNPVYNYRVNYESASRSQDIFGYKYQSSMKEIDRVLNEYILKYPEFDIGGQQRKRYIALKSKEALNALKQKNVQKAKEVTNEESFRKNLKLINFRQLSVKKKMFLLAIKLRFMWALAIYINL